MNRSKKQVWSEIVRLYTEKELSPAQILDDLKSNKYFAPNTIPSIAMIYAYLCRTGISSQKRKDAAALKALRIELGSLKSKLQKTRFQKQVKEIVDAFKSDELEIDDIAKEKIAEMKILMDELVNDARKKENGQINVDKLSKVVKLLDTWTNTLLKARVLEDKATDKIDMTVKETLLDKMRTSYIDETVKEIEEDLKDNG